MHSEEDKALSKRFDSELARRQASAEKGADVEAGRKRRMKKDGGGRRKSEGSTSVKKKRKPRPSAPDTGGAE